MTRPEDAVRRALDLDPDATVDPAQMLGDVRQGARRRQARRRTAGVVAATVVLVAGVAGGTALLTGSDSGEPQPVPQPSETVTDPAPRPGAVPRDAMAVEAAAGQVFVTANEADCDCSAFWRFDGTGWERLHDFPTDFVERLAMAPDGANGWAASPGGPLWATHDGGESWRPLGITNIADDSWMPIATSTHGWALSLSTGTVFRTRVDSDEFEIVVLPGGPRITGIGSVRDNVLATPESTHEGSVAAEPLTTWDAGDTWTAESYPCTEQAADSSPGLLSARTAGFVTCPAGSGWEIHRTVDLGTWTLLAQINGPVRDVVPLDEGRVVVTRGGSADLVTGNSVTEIDLRLGPGGNLYDGTSAEGRDYLTTLDGGLLVSTDGGHTWQPVGRT